MMSGKTWMIALSQMFFSLSVLSTTMVVYGSYLKESDDIPLSAIATAFGDTAVAVTAGFLIFPAVFSFGVKPSAGSGLVFVALPMIFQKMPGRGTLWDVVLPLVDIRWIVLNSFNARSLC